MNPDARNAEPPASGGSLWVLVAPPAVWAAHFLLSYVTAAVWCAKFAGPDGSLGVARVAIAAYTLAALVAIGLIGARMSGRHDFGYSILPHDADSALDRQRFLDFTTLILSGLSAIAVVYTALPAIFIGSCH